jgi:hypothetical protein
MLYVGRVIVGFAGGVCAAIAPCYIGMLNFKNAADFMTGL